MGASTSKCADRELNEARSRLAEPNCNDARHRQALSTRDKGAVSRQDEDAARFKDTANHSCDEDNSPLGLYARTCFYVASQLDPTVNGVLFDHFSLFKLLSMNFLAARDRRILNLQVHLSPTDYGLRLFQCRER